MDILVVCTAGRCRSPVAAALLRRAARMHPVTMTVRSAGLRFNGEPVPPIAVALMADRGVDLPQHGSTQVSATSLASADLVIGMTRSHVRDVMLMSPDAAEVSFTLKDLVRRAETAPRGRHQRWDDWLAARAADRPVKSLLASDPDDDIADPFAQPRRVWEQTIDEIDALVTQLPALIRPRSVQTRKPSSPFPVEITARTG